jgi:L-fuculose-phosphate aldolase
VNWRVYKEELIHTGKELVDLGLVAATWGNISIRLPKNQGVIITPSGMDYYNINPEDLVVLDLQGKVLEGERKPSSEKLLHLTIYRHRPDVQAVVHTHSPYATAYAVVRKPIPALVEDLVQIVGGDVDVALYASPGTQELADHAVNALAGKMGVLLANHGVIGVGRDITEALRVCQLIEKTAQIGIMAKMLGEPVFLSDDEKRIMRQAYLFHYGQKEEK